MVDLSFLGIGGGDDKEQESPPIEEVRELSDQGYSQHEITEELRDRGYTYSQINKAMNRAVRDSARNEGRGGRREQPPSRESGGGTQLPLQDTYEGGQDMNQRQGRGGGNQPQQQYSDQDWDPQVGIGPEEEALIETIVEEKLIDVQDEFGNIFDRLNELEDRIDDIERDVNELVARKDEDEKEFIQRVNEIEEYLQDSQSRIGGLEKAFQQTLPSLVENVRDLTDLVRDMKDEEV